MNDINRKLEPSLKQTKLEYKISGVCNPRIKPLFLKKISNDAKLDMKTLI